MLSLYANYINLACESTWIREILLKSSFRGNAYLSTLVRLEYRWAMPAGNCTAWSTESIQMVT